MKRSRAIALAGLAMLSAAMIFKAFAGASAKPDGGQITVEEAFVRPTVGASRISAAFMTIANHSGAPDTLVLASSDAAATVELHGHKLEGGVMKMRAIAKIEIPARGEAVLEPGGDHIMLIGLKEALEPGDLVPLKLSFGSGAEVAIEVPVKALSDEASHGGHEGSHGH